MPFSLPDLSIPVTIFFALYAFFLLFYVIYGLFNLMHLLEYGRVGAPLFAIVILFVAGTVLLVAASIFWMMQYDASYTVPLGDALSLFKQTFLHGGNF